MTRRVAVLALLPMLLSAGCSRDPQADPAYLAACHGAPLRSIEERNAAMERGYLIHPVHDCIDKSSFDAVEREEAKRGTAREAKVSEQRIDVDRSLSAERAGFATAVSLPPAGLSIPEPPAELFQRHVYDEARGLVAFVTPDPGDGGRHPAIVWITGGDCSSLGEFWVEGPPQNDQSASAYRKAGVVMLFATLRGGNGSRANREAFFGEVDDVRAAAWFLAKLPYVDPDRIYVGGHSTGGTLALLVAESGGGFAGVFAFGPVRSPTAYPPSLMSVDFRQLPRRELRLRSPAHWLDDITVPTYLIEGTEPPGNFGELEELCALTRNPAVHCIPVPGHDHFSVLHAVNRRLAARIAVGGNDSEPLIEAAQFAR